VASGLRKEAKIRCGKYNQHCAYLCRSSWSLPLNSAIRCCEYIETLFGVAISGSSVAFSEYIWSVNCSGCVAKVLKLKGNLTFLKLMKFLGSFTLIT
jgi:hypothetical protein